MTEFDQAPRAGLSNVLARLYDAQLDFRDAAAVLLAPPPDTPLLACLAHAAQRLSVVRELEAEVHGEFRAMHLEVKAEYERNGTAA